MVLDTLRVRIRGDDPALDELLLAMRVIGEHHKNARAHREVERKRMAVAASSEVKQWLTTSEAAERLGLSERRVRQLIGQGRLPAERDPAERTWRVRRADVDAYADRYGTA